MSIFIYWSKRAKLFENFAVYYQSTSNCKDVGSVNDGIKVGSFLHLGFLFPEFMKTGNRILL